MTIKTYPRCDQTKAWSSLQMKFQEHGRSFDLRKAFESDANRFATFSMQAPHVFADLSKNLIDPDIEALLMQLARECDVELHRDAMFAGVHINASENRAVGHVFLRQTTAPKGKASEVAGVGEIQGTLDEMLRYAESVRSNADITDVVNIGIGGSDLGPQMAVLALESFTSQKRRMHFVSNVDGHELAATLKNLKPKNTLFLVASKTFTTLETMTNARSAKAWFLANGGSDTEAHFAALTTNVKAAKEFGINTTFGFWDWVGGRYSMWSAIGLPIAIAIGAESFRSMLAGAHAMDEHFRSAKLEQNLPVRLALLDVWYRNFLGFTSRCVAPYHSGLKRLPAYLQQLEMESNGKRVDMNGSDLPFGTSPVIWGEPGTNGQHAFFQMLHQGTDVVPVEFIAAKKASHQLAEHQTLLLANALAQAQALMVGRSNVQGERNFPGNRPSTFLLLQELTPETLGALIALYEHRVFVAGALWGINSFDQWGVELGKVLAADIALRLNSGKTDGLDASTSGLMYQMRS